MNTLRPPHPSRAATSGPIWAVFLLGLLLYGTLALEWERRGLFDQHNVLFDTDLKSRLECYADGWVGHGRNLQHSNLCNLVNPPVRVIAGLLPGTAGTEDKRSAVARFVAPTAGAAAVALTWCSALLLGAPGRRAALVTGLFGLSFSQLLMAGIPDHLALGGFTIALAAWACARSAAARPLPQAAWWGIGWLAAGITITNIAPVALLYLASRRGDGDGWLRATVRSAGFALLAVALALATSLLLNLGYGITDPAVLYPDTGVGPLKTEPWRELTSFPGRVVQSFAPTGYHLIPNALARREPHHYDVEATLAEVPIFTAMAPAALAVALLLAASAASGLRRSGTRTPAALALLAATAFHGVFHARIGSDYFLYATHWTPLVALLPTLPQPPSARGERLWSTGIAVVLVLVAANSAWLLYALANELQPLYHPLGQHPWP